MNEISTNLIKQAVYKLCFDANTCLDESVYSKILAAYKTEKNIEMINILKSILDNAKIAFETKKPLCQDTGQVIVFVEIGHEVLLTGGFIEDEINSAVEECYCKNFFRKSVVQNALFNRENTKTNTPAIIYTKYKKGRDIQIKVLIKGAGSENKSELRMLLPTSNENEIIKACSDMILKAGENACPPMFIGIGAGGTAEKACLMSKKALLCNKFSDKELELAEKIKNAVNMKMSEKYGNSYVLDIKLRSCHTHIACMPVAAAINCHSERISCCKIKDNKIFYEHKQPAFIETDLSNQNLKEIYAHDIEGIKALSEGEEFLLTGEIYVARDMAHKKIYELMKRGAKLPFEIKNSIIFYAGPCPNKSDNEMNSIGPTTASRMDKYAAEFYNAGMLASIGKGNRNSETVQIIKQTGAKYFTVTGGIAALLAQRVKSCEIIAYPELGAEAVYKLYAEKFPLKTVL